MPRLLEEEVEALLGRRKSERRAATDAPRGYRNGFGKPRQLALSSGTIAVHGPRARDLEQRFVSWVSPCSSAGRRRSALRPALCLRGLALGDFELAVHGLLGEGAPLSPSSILRLKTEWQAQ